MNIYYFWEDILYIKWRIIMSNSLDKLKALTSRLESKLEEKQKQTIVKIPSETRVETTGSTHDINTRNRNIVRVESLFSKLNIAEKAPDFTKIFDFKAMNLSGIGLKEDNFGEIREGKYIQIIAITYEADKYGKKRAKNISLGYFGKAETIDEAMKNEIIEFVLRWRYEKAFQNVSHYAELLERIDTPKDRLF